MIGRQIGFTITLYPIRKGWSSKFIKATSYLKNLSWVVLYPNLKIYLKWINYMTAYHYKNYMGVFQCILMNSWTSFAEQNYRYLFHECCLYQPLLHLEWNSYKTPIMNTVRSGLQSGTLFIFFIFWAGLYLSFCHFLLSKSSNFRDCIRVRTLIKPGL